MAKICVKFVQHNKTFRPGQTIRLKVEVETINPLRCRCISIRFLGVGEIKLRNSNGGVKKEEYLRSYQNLAGKKNGPDFELGRGKMSYEVEYPLPPNLPPSFEYKGIWIRYELKVNIDKVYMTDDSQYEIFTIIDPVELAFDALEPIKCSCCRSTQLKFSVPRVKILSGLYPVPFDVESEKQCDIEEIKIKLSLELKLFTSQNPVKVINTLLGEETFRNAFIEEEKRIFSGLFTVGRRHEIIDLRNSRMIQNRYLLEVRAKKIAPRSEDQRWHVFYTVPLSLFPADTAPQMPFDTSNMTRRGEEEASLPSYNEVNRSYLNPSFVNSNRASPLAHIDRIAPPSYQEALQKLENVHLDVTPSAPPLE